MYLIHSKLSLLYASAPSHLGLIFLSLFTCLLLILFLCIHRIIFIITHYDYFHLFSIWSSYCIKSFNKILVKDWKYSRHSNQVWSYHHSTVGLISQTGCNPSRKFQILVITVLEDIHPQSTLLISPFLRAQAHKRCLHVCTRLHIYLCVSKAFVLMYCIPLGFHLVAIIWELLQELQ